MTHPDDTPRPAAGWTGDDAATGQFSREETRERARELRETQQRFERRRGWIIRGTIAGAVVLLLGAVAVALVFAAAPSVAGPANMAGDAVSLGSGLIAERSDSGAAAPAYDVAAAESGVPQVRFYVDYLCAECADFERQNGDQLREWVDSGAVALEIHPIAVLETSAAGSQYSLRAANAAACVAQYAPDDFFEFHDALLRAQPLDGSVGLDDAALTQLAISAGAPDQPAFTDCIGDRRYRSWVVAATKRALADPVDGTKLVGVPGAPTILVNDRLFTSADGYDPAEFGRFVQIALGESFVSTATPTPVPSASPTAESDG